MTKEMEKNALNQDELEQASGGYIVDRGFWRDYWVADERTGKTLNGSVWIEEENSDRK